MFGGVVNEAIEKAKTADAFVFGSPVHYASAAGNMASFMDRLAYAGGKYLAYKPAAVCCSARRAGTTSTLDQLVKYPQFFHMPLVNGSYWAMVHGSNPEQVLQDAEGCAVMQELGRNMAWLLHCIEAGRAAFLWAILYNFPKHFLSNLSATASVHYKISAVPAQKGRECFFRS